MIDISARMIKYTSFEGGGGMLENRDGVLSVIIDKRDHGGVLLDIDGKFELFGNECALNASYSAYSGAGDIKHIRLKIGL